VLGGLADTPRKCNASEIVTDTNGPSSSLPLGPPIPTPTNGLAHVAKSGSAVVKASVLWSGISVNVCISPTPEEPRSHKKVR